MPTFQQLREGQQWRMVHSGSKDPRTGKLRWQAGERVELVEVTPGRAIRFRVLRTGGLYYVGGASEFK